MSSYVFMDESGNLGFDFSKSKTTKYFVVTFLFVNDKRSMEKVVKKVFSGFSQLEIKNHHGTLHAYKEKPATRQRVLNSLAKKDVHILVIKLNKHNVHTRLKDEKHFLYNYVVNILLDRMMKKNIVDGNQPIQFIASKRETNKLMNENFKNYLQKQIKGNHKLDIVISIKTPSEEKGLQVVDICSWSFFRKYEHDDSAYADIVSEKVIEESSLY